MNILEVKDFKDSESYCMNTECRNCVIMEKCFKDFEYDALKFKVKKFKLIVPYQRYRKLEKLLSE
jgi:hypothetical protein